MDASGPAFSHGLPFELASKLNETQLAELRKWLEELPPRTETAKTPGVPGNGLESQGRSFGVSQVVGPERAEEVSSNTGEIPIVNVPI